MEIQVATRNDLETLVDIFSQAMEDDVHTQLKARDHRPTYRADMIRGGLEGWIDNPKYTVLKAVSTSDSEIMGWICWAEQKSEMNAGGPATVPSTEQVKVEEGPDPIKRLEALTSADMQRWMQFIMPPGTCCMFISTLSIRPSQQGRGVGHTLIDWGTRRADEKNLFCWVHSSEAGTRGFEKAGFREKERLEVNLDEYDPHGEEGKQKWGRYVFRYMVREPVA